MIHETIKSRGKPKYYCRQRKGVVKVRYLVYLFGCVLLVGGGAVCSVTPSGIRLDVANLLSLLDYTTLAFLLIACVLVLLGNNSFRAFGWAISRICHLFESAITSGRVSVAKDVGRDRTGG